jgi:hypothetical protein
MDAPLTVFSNRFQAAYHQKSPTIAGRALFISIAPIIWR